MRSRISIPLGRGLGRGLGGGPAPRGWLAAGLLLLLTPGCERAVVQFRPPRVSSGPFPREVTWPSGESLTIPAPPRRVYLASTTVVDFAAALLAPERVAGLCAHARTASILALEPTRWPDLAEHERFVAEPVLALAPDLVLCSEYNDANTVAALRRAGIALLPVPAVNSLDEALATLALLGRALGEETKADALIAQCQARRAKLPAAASTTRRALCFTHNPTGSWTGGRGTLHDEALRLAGLHNAAARVGMTGHLPITSEQILALDPDLVVLDLPVGGGRSSLSLLRENPALARLRALATGQVVELPAALYATGSHHVLDAAERIAAAVAALPEVTKPPESRR